MRVTPDCDSINSLIVSNAYGVQLYPDIAFGGGNYMVVWSDERNTCAYVYAARVTPGGTVLDPNGIQVGPSNAIFQFQPAVAFDGTRFFTVWCYMSPYAINGRFINQDGSLGDTTRVIDAGDKIADLKIAFDGTNYLVVWIEYTVSGYIARGIRVAGDGTPIGSAFTIASAVYRMNSIDLCFDGYNYLVTYCSNATGSFRIYGRKYDTDGVPVGAEIAISNSSYACYFGAAAPGTDNHYLNAWSEDRGSSYDLYGNVDLEIVGIEERHTFNDIGGPTGATLFSGPLVLPEGDMHSLFDASGSRVYGNNPPPGVYFIEIEGNLSQKIIKIQ